MVMLIAFAGLLALCSCFHHHSVISPHHPPTATSSERNGMLGGILGQCDALDDSAYMIDVYGLSCASVAEVTIGLNDPTILLILDVFFFSLFYLSLPTIIL
jgi:hypothetical protein